MNLGPYEHEYYRMEHEPITAYRIWRRESTDPKGIYRSVYKVCLWLEGVMLSSPSPDRANGVGFYAYKTREQALANATSANDLVGVVKLSGHIAEHRDGYRAQRATMVNLLSTGPKSKPKSPARKQRTLKKRTPKRRR